MKHSKGISTISVVTIIFIVLVFATVTFLLSLNTNTDSNMEVKKNCNQLSTDDPSCINDLLKN